MEKRTGSPSLTESRKAGNKLLQRKLGGRAEYNQTWEETPFALVLHTLLGLATTTPYIEGVLAYNLNWREELSLPKGTIQKADLGRIKLGLDHSLDCKRERM